jgi:nucleotide-binding universal stress UspA family protein
MIPLRVILHPTDFSTHSDYAFRLACSLARDHGARVIALHVMPHPMAYGEAGAYAAAEDQRPALLADLRQLQARDNDPPVEHRLREGDAAGEIVRLAEETQCDLIVMGTHGRRGLGRLLLGSVAEDVMRHAPCPVLTVKASVPATSPLLAQLAQEAVAP